MMLRVNTWNYRGVLRERKQSITAVIGGGGMMLRRVIRRGSLGSRTSCALGCLVLVVGLVSCGPRPSGEAQEPGRPSGAVSESVQVPAEVVLERPKDSDSSVVNRESITLPDNTEVVREQFTVGGVGVEIVEYESRNFDADDTPLQRVSLTYGGVTVIAKVGVGSLDRTWREAIQRRGDYLLIGAGNGGNCDDCENVTVYSLSSGQLVYVDCFVGAIPDQVCDGPFLRAPVRLIGERWFAAYAELSYRYLDGKLRVDCDETWRRSDYFKDMAFVMQHPDNQGGQQVGAADTVMLRLASAAAFAKICGRDVEFQRAVEMAIRRLGPDRLNDFQDALSKADRMCGQVR